MERKKIKGTRYYEYMQELKPFTFYKKSGIGAYCWQNTLVTQYGIQVEMVQVFKVMFTSSTTKGAGEK